MKVLYVDFNTIGHHSIYYRTISQIDEIDPVLILPNKTDIYDTKQYEISCLSRNMSAIQYSHAMNEIKKIVENEKPDVVHILSGDMLYRFFGWQLPIKGVPIVVTFHHMGFSMLKKISYRAIFKKIEVGICHTEYIYAKIKKLNIENVKHIEYPFLEDKINYDKTILKKQLGIPEDRKVLLAFGETRYDKGLDILLKALNQISEPFHLVIAGKPTEITIDEIDNLSKGYKDKITLFPSYIDNEMMCKLFDVSDIVVLPYRKKFTGASGPLTTAVVYEKMIIGPNINSIGDIITRYHLGNLFNCEDIKSLEQTINKALNNNFVYDKEALKYFKLISMDTFKKRYSAVYESVSFRGKR